jgi:hypothetical protein
VHILHLIYTNHEKTFNCIHQKVKQMIAGPTKLVFALLTVAVLGDELHKHKNTEEEGEGLPEMPGEWAQADQEEMPMKGQKKPADKPKKSAVLEKKMDINIQKHEDDDADETDVKKAAPAPAPLVKDVMKEASKEDDADTKVSAVELGKKSGASHTRAGVKIEELLGGGIFAELLKHPMPDISDEEYAKMSEEEFAAHAEEVTKPLMDSLYKMVDDHQTALKKKADADPQTKWMLELFDPMQFEQIYPDEAKKKAEEREANRLEMIKWEKEHEEKKKTEAALKKEFDSFNLQSAEVKSMFAKIKEEFIDIDAYEEDPAMEKTKKDLAKIQGVVENNEAIKKAIQQLTGKDDSADPSCAEARRATKNNKYNGIVEVDDEDVQSSSKKTQESDDDIEAAHQDLIKKESAMKKDQPSTVRSNVAVRVDANGDMVQMLQEEPKDTVQKPSVRQAADDTNSKDRNSVKATPDADDKKAPSKPHTVFDDGYQSPEDKQKQEEEAQKRSHYLSIAGFVVVVLLVVWLLIRHRAQQMIDRSTAFDDASSVSSSTVTEENPTVKVNRALLERMANISQKLSEKVEEARASSNADSNSSGGSARQYTRKKQKDPLLGASA